MKRQTNEYGLSGDVASLLIVQNNGNKQCLLFPSVYLDDVKRFHWSFKGKNGTFNEFNVSFAAYFANIYGYSDTNWRRKDPNSGSYFSDNYQEKLLTHGKDVKNWSAITEENRFAGLQTEFFPRVKWRTKTQCETLELNVRAFWAGNHSFKVCIKVNTHLRHHVPMHVKTMRGDNRLRMLDGKLLAAHIIENAGGVDDDAKRISGSYTNRGNELDYRVDPTTMCFANTKYSHRRVHRVEVDGKPCAVIEVIDSPLDSNKWHWRWNGKRNIDEQFLCGESGGWRRSYVLMDYVSFLAIEKLSPELVVYYNYEDMEWFVHEPVIDPVSGFNNPKKHQLKRAILRAAGAKVDYEYFQPRMTKAYAAALKAAESSETFGIADRRRAKFENATGEDKAKMFTAPKVSHFRHIYANKCYFESTLYGGVGIWCKDLRVDSMLIGTNAQLQGVVVDKKQDVRKRRL